MILVPLPRTLRRCDGFLAPNSPTTISIQPATGHAQGYILSITPHAAAIVADDRAGAFYAQQTLAQLHRQFPDAIPCLTIEDWPDFPARGFMLDISRDKVPTMPTLFALIDQLAELKINQLQLYTEHTFAYRDHAVVWQDSSPMTAEEIRQLDAHCRDRFIELVPNQNSFGHLERWLKHPQYRELAEAPDGFVFPWGDRIHSGFTLNPLDPRSIALIENLYDELLPNFSSKLFNVGCDETLDIGKGRSREEVARRGRDLVYLEFLLKIHDAVQRRGRTMMFWGDIILHKPELLSEMPRDVIALNWGYEAEHPFDEQTLAFHDAGAAFYVCPGTSSWCSITGRTDNAIANLRSAAEHGLRNGAIGYLITDWGDRGHLQYLPISYLGLAAGAAFSWCLATNRDLPLIDALNIHIFRDRAGVMGKLVHDLGNVYLAMREPLPNSTALFWKLIGEREEFIESVTREEYIEAEKRIDAAAAELDRARMDRDDADLIRDEIRNAVAMLKFACHLGRGGFDLFQERRLILAAHKRLWLARNRPGGLSESIARLNPANAPST